jgi:hypothetical protein
LALLIVRVIVGIIFVAHGAQKLFGAFGGPGLAAVVEMMGPLGYPVTIGEFFGGLGLIVGQEPPTIDCSTTTVFWPCFARVQAMILPATPLPITRF